MCTNPRPRRLLLTTSACALLLVGWAAGAHSDHGCDGCHVPHNASALPGLPLWNGHETVISFTMYSSPTFQGSIDAQPGMPSNHECNSSLPRTGFRLAYPSWRRVFNVGFRAVCADAPASDSAGR